MTLAPIMIPTYRRLDHLRESLDALAANPLARDSVIYLTSDGPRPGDEAQVAAVRAYLATVGGFKRGEVLARDVNDRLGNWRVRRQLAAEHGKLIFLEEDCVTSPDFLGYMNECLERFRDDTSVFSVSAYLPPAVTPSTSAALHRIPRFNAWGFGIWARSERLVRCHLPVAEFNELASSPAFRRKVRRGAGLNLWGMLRRVAEGKLLAYDSMACLEVLRCEMDVIYPGQALVRNTGIDGSGEHCGTGTHFDVALKTGAGDDWAAAPVQRDTDAIRAVARFYGSDAAGGWRFLSRRLKRKLKLPQDLVVPERIL